MSKAVITLLLSFCPGHDYDSRGQIITNQCQEGMNNCMITRTNGNEATEKEFYECARELKSKYGSSFKIPATSIK